MVQSKDLHSSMDHQLSNRPAPPHNARDNRAAGNEFQFKSTTLRGFGSSRCSSQTLSSFNRIAAAI